MLGILTIGICYLFCIRGGVFGAEVDWISQHSVLPDYFRQQFYETGRLFPEFAANIGGGQNIYNFAYYGLYNPLLLPSYLLPFIKMSDYMTAVQLLGLTASVLLMYRWLGKRGFSKGICAGTAVLFLLSGPMVFHSYHQIMFVDYMPFLLMGLMGVDRYFQYAGRRGGMLTISVFLMIMTSFYFSIGGMLALVLYGIHRWLMCCDEEGKKVTVRSFLIEGAWFALHFIAAVMMSGILLVPTAFALTGREGEGAVLRLGELLLPEVRMARFCYSPYGIGMVSLAVTALTALLFGRKWHERILALSCGIVLTVPVFAFLLNGGLYVRDKVMIPFLPLLCYILAYYLDRLDRTGGEEEAGQYSEMEKLGGVCAGKNLRRQTGEICVRFLPYILTVILVYLSWRRGEIEKYGKWLLLESILSLACFSVYYWAKTVRSKRARFTECRRKHGKNAALLLLPVVLMLAVSGYQYNGTEGKALDREFYEEMTDPDIGRQIKKVVDEEEGFYRTEQLGNDTENAANLNRIWDMGQYVSSIYSSSYHEGYREFRKNTFWLEEPFRNFLMQSAVHNPVYQRFMGIKYVVSKEEVPGYEAVECEGKSKWKVYENNQVSPIAYGTDQVISEEAYRELEFPYNQLALLKYAVVKDSKRAQPARDGNGIGSMEDHAGEEVKPISLNLPEAIDSDLDKKLQIDLPDLQEGENVLFLSFRIENRKPSKDVAVWVEGIRNKLTARSHFYYNKNTEFTYAVPLEEGQDMIEMVFGKGSYEISDARAYLGSLRVDEGKLYQSVFLVDRERTKGNRIEGTIEAERRGYFITTIPYDENFEILVDEEQAEAEEVNTAFLGFEIEAGEHEVRIVYHAPGVRAGKMMSLMGVLLLGGMMFYSKGHISFHSPGFRF